MARECRQRANLREAESAGTDLASSSEGRSSESLVWRTVDRSRQQLREVKQRERGLEDGGRSRQQLRGAKQRECGLEDGGPNSPAAPRCGAARTGPDVARGRERLTHPGCSGRARCSTWWGRPGGGEDGHVEHGHLVMRQDTGLHSSLSLTELGLWSCDPGRLTADQGWIAGRQG